MPQTEALPHEPKLETVLGLPRDVAVYHLTEKHDVSIQSVAGFCKNLRFDFVSQSLHRIETDPARIPCIIYGVVRQRGTGDVLMYKRRWEEGKHAIGTCTSVRIDDYYIDPNGYVDHFKTLGRSMYRSYADVLNLSSARGGGKRWYVEELEESSAELFFHGFITEHSAEVGVTHLGVIATLWLDETITVNRNDSPVDEPHWSSLESCVAGQLNGDYDFEDWSKSIIQHMYSFPRDVAPVNAAEIKAQYSTLIPK